MKVLFLDVDGVLNMYGSGNLYTINENRLKLLKYIVERTNCRLVVSSTWRKLKDHREALISKLQFKKMSVYSWTTTEFFMERQMRGHEIEKWLDEHDWTDRYAIVDDDSDFLPSQMKHFVQTDGRVGLTMENAEKIIEILNGTT